ncbi:MAG: mandelate racemase/muconate lactonizing enzyme family protein [Actinomycetota bacterium]|jgi:L-alanine-DL-glutamate epimerase-like enolase superfamily enzyme|nr:mandelate racemase/muconate lactonizing enzyme family protein [Actinomycetota bacterium]
MKITDIKCCGLTGATPPGGWIEELHRDDVAHSIIAVHTEDGLVGIGSVFSSAALVEGALATLAPLYLGENALEPDRVSEKLHQHTFWFGRGGTITHTISGINIALWDLLGQATGQPVGRLLGGRYRDRVQPYASILADDPAPMRDELERWRSLGFRAFKIGWGPFGRHSAQMDDTIVRSAREAVGPDAILAVDTGASDAHWPHGYKWALRTSQMLADYDVAWFEEALPPDDLHGYTELRRFAPVPIAGGEVLTRRQEFARYLQAGAFDIVQPDTTKGGGLSESRRIGWTADQFGARLIPHGWNTAVGLVADLHLASALPLTDLVEYKTGSPYIDELTVPGFRLDADGMLEIPDAPGLGVCLDLDAVARWGTSDLGIHGV